MKKLNPLLKKLSMHFLLHLSRKRTLLFMVFGLLCGKTSISKVSPFMWKYPNSIADYI